MAVAVAELRDWLSPLKDADQVALDDGGLALVLIDHEDEIYFEIGGVPDDEEG